MKFWKSEDPCLRKEHRILTWAVVGQLILYVLFSVVLAILTWGQFIGGWVILGVMGFGWATTLLNYHIYRLASPWNTSDMVMDEMYGTTEELPPDTIPYRYSLFIPYFNRQMAHSLTSKDSFIIHCIK